MKSRYVICSITESGFATPPDQIGTVAEQNALASPVTRNGQKLVSVSVDLCQNQFP